MNDKVDKQFDAKNQDRSDGDPIAEVDGQDWFGQDFKELFFAGLHFLGVQLIFLHSFLPVFYTND